MRTGFQIPTDEFVEKLKEVYGPVADHPKQWKAARFGSEELQSKRMEVLSELLIESDDDDWWPRYKSVLDVGCGRGQMVSWAPYEFGYTGIDIVPEVIEAARKEWPATSDGQTRWPKFEVHDLRDEPRPAEAVIACCSFSISNDEIFWSVLDAMWESATKLVAFNCKSTWAPDDCEPAGGISYLRDPAQTLAECWERYTRNLVLRHDYLDHDFTLAMYK